MKYKQLRISLLLLFITGIAGLNAQTMNVMEKSGTKTSFPISEIRSIDFTSNKLNVNKKDGSINSTTLLNVRNLNFTSVTGLLTPVAEGLDALIYPNPMQDVLNIDCENADIMQPATIEVITIDGKVLYRATFSPQQTKQLSINVSGWQKGIYIVHINNGKAANIKKIIKN